MKRLIFAAIAVCLFASQAFAILPGLMSGVASGAPVLTYITTVSSTANASSYTFNGVSLGPEASDRLIILAINVADDNRLAGITSTINGNATTEAVFRSVGTNEDPAIEIAYLVVPTGTTATITVSFTLTSGQQAESCAVAVYHATGYNSATPTHINSNALTNNSAEISTTLNISGGGFAVAAASSRSTSGTYTWTGLTEDNDLIAENVRSWASDDGLGAETGRTITATLSTTHTRRVIAAASWR